MPLVVRIVEREHCDTCEPSSSTVTYATNGPVGEHAGEMSQGPSVTGRRPPPPPGGVAISRAR
jgi:hypothetical protein